MGKLELIAFLVGIEGMHYHPTGEYWRMETGDGNEYLGELDDIIKRAYREVT